MIGRAFMGNALTGAPMQPYIAPAPFLRRGSPLGLDQLGRIVSFDPWLMKKRRLISSMIFLVIGNKDSGKSTLLKSMTALLMCLQAQDGQKMRVRINDRKPEDGEPEWAPLARELGCDFVPLKGGDEYRVDPDRLGARRALLTPCRQIPSASCR